MNTYTDILTAALFNQFRITKYTFSNVLQLGEGVAELTPTTGQIWPRGK